MLFPLADTPNPPGRAYVTWGLMAINILVYVAISWPATMGKVDLNDPILLEYLRAIGALGKVSASDVYQGVNAYDLLVFEYGFRPAIFSPLTLLTSIFLHGGLMHLAGNMLFLFIFGDNVEFRLGRVRYLLTYLFCGVAATLFFALFAVDPHVPLIGASGAISGILGCYFLWFPRNRVRCFIFFFPFIMTSIYLSARVVLGFYLLVQNLLPFLMNPSAATGVAYGAHLGGFFAGMGVAWGADSYYRIVRRVGRVREKQPASLESIQKICPAVSSGDLAAASECYLGISSREERLGVESVDALAVGNYLQQQGRLSEALYVFRRFIAERQTDEQIAQAYLGAGKTMVQQPRYLTSAYHYFLSAIDLARSEELATEAKEHLRMIDKNRTSQGEE